MYWLHERPAICATASMLSSCNVPGLLGDSAADWQNRLSFMSHTNHALASRPIDDQRAKAWYRIEAGIVLLRKALAEAAGLKA